MRSYAAVIGLSMVVGALCAPKNPLLWGRDTCTTNDLGLPSGGLKGKNGVAWGWNPDVGAGTQMSAITSAADNKKPSTYGLYSQITSNSGYDPSQLTGRMADIKASGAVLVAHVMPTGLKLSEVDVKIAGDIANMVKQFTSQGVEVWLRFAHEVNWYTTPDASPRYYGNAADFIKAWKIVHDAVKDIEGCLMFWSPNQGSVSDLQKWFPGADYVDIVGVDVYVSDTKATFENTFGDFYNTFAKGYNKHMALGETGNRVNNWDVKANLVKQLANTYLKAYPCFQSVTWFEYLKVESSGQPSTDHRVIMGQSSAHVGQTLGNFA
ncbi:glycoside hydrolase superfamily [Hypomontagnella monticulosa]|nr:glycoside hydrolase superfamily [Hypomontagnella monticulosa]